MKKDCKKVGEIMRITNGIRKLRKAVALMAVVATAAGSMASGLSLNRLTASAATTTTEVNKQDLLDLRMIFTTDLHGMLSSMDYLAGTDFGNAGLAKANMLIKKTRSELNSNNVFTFDIGDVLFEASMEYIYGQDEEAIQPIYQGMSMVGYDAITLGNHDFDYGKEYLLRQLTYSGLLDKVVVSNLTNAKDGSHPFHQNMIIEREAVTRGGNKVTVKVGVIGETIPTLSAKTDNYAGIYKTEDIVANVKKESALLKEQGADIIVVLAHSGFGAEEPVEFADNVTYALTKIDDVDMILCGHEHNEFPTKEKSNYYDYSGVDAKTGLVNGKLVVMAKSQGKSIGVADISLSYDDKGEFKIEKQSGEVRRISEYKLGEDESILSCFSGWEEELETYRTQQLIELADGVTLQNYLGLLGDSPVLQLQNDARIAYARKYIESVNTAYAGYPVIAAASHISYGANSADDFVNISGSISYADLFTVQNYRNYTYIYKITGAQLKEWLELSASAYTTLQAGSSDLQFLINSEWMQDWSKFFVFDGINYTISPYIQPRYDINGKKINDTNRVSNVTYNGKAVTDDMELIIACNTITPTGIFSWAANQQIKGMYRTQNIIADYLQSLSKFGKYTPTADNNWTIAFKENQEFLMLLPNQADKFATSHEMYQSTKLKMDEKTIYQFKATKVKASEPHIVALQSNLDPTNKYYDVYVDAFSSAGIKSIKYGSADYDINDSFWISAREVKDNKFTVYFNETYTIYVEDNAGKKAVYKVIIDNIGSKEMAAPKVWSFNNTKSVITGRGEAGAMIYVELANKTYKKRANSDGSYSIVIPTQLARTSFYVYQEDTSEVKEGEEKRVSEKTKVYVKYNAPNIVTVDKYYNNSQYLTGNTNQDGTVVVVVDEDARTVYVSNNGGLNILQSSIDVDFSTFEIVETEQIIDADGNFKMELPNIEVGTSLRVINMDHVGRVGVSTYITVNEGGPYAPEFYSLVDTESTIYGNVVSVTSNKKLTVILTVDGVDYAAVADNNGNFKVNLVSPLTAGMTVSAYSTDLKDGKYRNSKTTTTKVKSVTTLEKSDEITLSNTAYNSSKVTINYLPKKKIVISIPYVDGTIDIAATTNSNGVYTVKLTKELQEGALVKVVSRNNLGKLEAVSYTLVTYRQPTKPVLITKLNNTSKYMKVVTKEDCTLFVEIGMQIYQSDKGVYNKEQNGYVHVIKFDRLPSGTKVSMYARNITTNSKRVNYLVEKKAPDAPTNLQVSTATNGSIQINGNVELFLINSEKEPTLKLTKTKVFARVNGTNYTGTLQEDGSFTVLLPTGVKAEEVTLYAYNRYGYGPQTVIMIPKSN